ncbi:MAG: hypothetical protein AAFX76_03635 [Planctomycetota bacterium]
MIFFEYNLIRSFVNALPAGNTDLPPIPELSDEVQGTTIFFVYVLPVLLGIATTILVFLAKAYFSNTFMPWYKHRIEQSFTVKGRWKATTNPSYDAAKKYEETIYIQQLSEKIWGDIFYKETVTHPDNSTEDIEKHFEFEGTFANSVLSATYWNPDRTQKGRGTFCLYSRDSDILTGKYSWYEPDTGVIEAGDYEWERQEK